MADTRTQMIMALSDIKNWKRWFVNKQRKNHPNISDKELMKRMKRAKCRKFRGMYDTILIPNIEERIIKRK